MLVPLTRAEPIVDGYAEFFGGISDGAGRSGFPVGIGGGAQSTNGFSVEIEERRVVVDHVNRDICPAGRAVVGEFFAEVVGDVIGGTVAVKQSGLHARGRDSRGLETVESSVVSGGTYEGPAVVGEGVCGVFPSGAKIEVLIIKIPLVAVVDEGDSGGEIDLGILKRFLGIEDGGEPRGGWPGAPDAVVVDGETGVGQDEAVSRAVGRNWPWLAVVVGHGTSSDAIFVFKSDSFAPVIEQSGPRAENTNGSGDVVDGAKGGGIGSTNDDAFEGLEESFEGRSGVEFGEGEVGPIGEFPLGDVEGGGGEVLNLDKFVAARWGMIHDLAEDDLL